MGTQIDTTRTMLTKMRIVALQVLLQTTLLVFSGYGVTVVHGYGGKSQRPHHPATCRSATAVEPPGRTATTTGGGACHRRTFWQQGGMVLGGAAAAATAIMTTGCLPLPPTWALSPEEAATAYNSYAATYDTLDAGPAASMLGIEEARTALLAKASGKVLEIGAGTGLNLYRYNPSQITSLTLLDISSGMLQQAQQRLEQDPLLQRQWQNIPIQWIQADATSELVSTLGGSAKFDTVVDSFSLCVMGNVGAKQCLDQIRQVVQPSRNGGKILLLENSISTNSLLAKYQDWTATTAASAGGKGCVYNQNVRAMIDAIPGLVVDKEVPFAAGLFRSFECSVQS
mmetsp:Transcript_67939/g.133617  ORF Transcript_67939/g.133617 Transcript_67939/m.133617 type:complete len:341 (-) Transcript_67939:463-1485(-)